MGDYVYNMNITKSLLNSVWFTYFSVFPFLKTQYKNMLMCKKKKGFNIL